MADSCLLCNLPHPGFNCTEEENASSLKTLRRRAWLALRAKVDEQTGDTVLLSKLRFAFEERFRYDEQGVPRVWKPEDDIDGAFKRAKDEVHRTFDARALGGSASLKHARSTDARPPAAVCLDQAVQRRAYPDRHSVRLDRLAFGSRRRL